MLAGLNTFIRYSGRNQSTARLYIQDGLVAMWDGIENAGWGKHRSNPAVWKDLIGELGDFDMSRVYRTHWESNGLFGPQTDGYSANLTTSQNLIPPNTWSYKSFSIEVLHYSRGIRRWSSVPWRNTFESWYTNTESLERINTTRISPRTTAYPGTSPLHISNVTTYNAQNKLHTAYENSGNGWKVRSMTDPIIVPDTAPYSGRIVFASNTLTAGGVFAIRIYNRTLTAEEIAYNYNIDKTRFKFS